MGNAAVRHVSVRVPWHDSAWNGLICQDARANSSCLALGRNAEGRDDAYETQFAGHLFSSVDRMPPCLAERGTFLSPHPFALKTQLDYSRYSDVHKHILPDIVHIPAFGGVLTPYRWMLREHAWELAEAFGLEAQASQEPKEKEAPHFIVDSPWVQNADNQRQLLDGFRRDLSEIGSLVFFYAKQTPLMDGASRQIVAVAKLSSIGALGEYPYEGGAAAGRLRSMKWERPFQHTLRPDSERQGAWKGGVVLPYHELLKYADTHEDLDIERFVAKVPSEAHDQFRYGTEHVPHGSAITTLQAVRNALEASAEILAGPWSEYLGWIDQEMSALWSMQGPAPGLGSALSCFDPKFNGTLFAHALATELNDGEDPWPIVEAIFDDRRAPPTGYPNITKMNRLRWGYVRSTTPKYELMQLLSRFELTREQASAAYFQADPGPYLKNPYALYEESRVSATPISLTTVDRNLYPSDATARRPDLPPSAEVDLLEPEDPLRIRAICVEALERAAEAGNTVLDSKRLSALVNDLPLSHSVTIDEITLQICKKVLEPEVAVTVLGDDTYAQLARYVGFGKLIRTSIDDRVVLTEAGPRMDWRPLVESEFKSASGVGIDEQAARKEKVAALEVLENSRIGILTGPAGTGKTTLLKILLNQQSVVGRDVLLLAPTGKARVRLGQQTGRPEQTRTLAQFLLEYGRYHGDTGRYVAKTDGQTASVTTCVIDECSMLTEDQLAALCSVVPTSARLIMVGDPQQLPPIGAGRPFVDIIAHLREAHKGAGLAELTVSRRQTGTAVVPALSLADVQLAALFSGRALAPGEDEIISAGGAPGDTDRLRFVSWDTPSSLREKLKDVLSQELSPSSADLETAVELSLGGRLKDDFIYFNTGAGQMAESWQILSINRNLASGSAELNRFLKETVRRRRLEYARSPGSSWRMVQPRGSDQITYGDKVICLRNHRRRRWSSSDGSRDGYLANGEVGIVTGEAGKGRPLKFTNVEFASQGGETYGFRSRDFAEESSPLSCCRF